MTIFDDRTRLTDLLLNYTIDTFGAGSVLYFWDKTEPALFVPAFFVEKLLLRKKRYAILKEIKNTKEGEA